MPSQRLTLGSNTSAVTPSISHFLEILSLLFGWQHALLKKKNEIIMGFLPAREIGGRGVQNDSLPSLVDIPSHTNTHRGCPLVFPHTVAGRTQTWQTNCTICSLLRFSFFCIYIPTSLSSLSLCSCFSRVNQVPTQT